MDGAGRAHRSRAHRQYGSSVVARNARIVDVADPYLSSAVTCPCCHPRPPRSRPRRGLARAPACAGGVDRLCHCLDAACPERLLGRDADLGGLPVLARPSHRACVLPHGRHAARRGGRLRRGPGPVGRVRTARAAQPLDRDQRRADAPPERSAWLRRADVGHDRGGRRGSGSALAPRVARARDRARRVHADRGRGRHARHRPSHPWRADGGVLRAGADAVGRRRGLRRARDPGRSCARTSMLATSMGS